MGSGGEGAKALKSEFSSSWSSSLWGSLRMSVQRVPEVWGSWDIDTPTLTTIDGGLLGGLLAPQHPGRSRAWAESSWMAGERPQARGRSCGLLEVRPLGTDVIRGGFWVAHPQRRLQ